MALPGAPGAWVRPGGRGPMIHVSTFGDWREAQRILGTAGLRFPVAMNKALRQEAHFLRRKMIENLKTGGSTSGRKFEPLKEGTLLSRRFRRRRSKKPLIETADMRNSITVHVKKGVAFVGLLRTARGKDGRPLANIGKVHEFGQTIAAPVTRAMLRYLHLMFRRGAKKKERHEGSMGIRLGEVLVIRVPPRPFIQPVANRYFLENKARARKRLFARVAILMAGDLGRVAVAISEFGGISVHALPQETAKVETVIPKGWKG